MRTFRYILSLLAATLALLAQPAMAQAPETSTKAQPSDPVFPYLLTIRQPAEGATLDVMIMNTSGTFTAVSSGQTVYNGTKVDLFFAPRKGYQLTEGSITYNGNATTAETLTPNDKGYTAQRSFTMPAQPTTVTAEAELIRYTITYDPNGGTLPQGSPTQYTVVSDEFTLPTPTHASTYVSFEGWKDAGGNTVTTVAKGSTGDLSLTAQWKESELVEAVGRPAETRIVTTIMTADEILAGLAATWPKLTFTTDRGAAIESLISWKLKDGVTLDLTPGKKNPFIWTATPLPDGVKDNGYVMSGTTQVYLEAPPITPEDNGEITITAENKFQQDGGTDNYFNGEINGEEGKTINKLTLTPPADTDMTIKLNGITSAIHPHQRDRDWEDQPHLERHEQLGRSHDRVRQRIDAHPRRECRRPCQHRGHQQGPFHGSYRTSAHRDTPRQHHPRTGRPGGKHPDTIHRQLRGA